MKNITVIIIIILTLFIGETVAQTTSFNTHIPIDPSIKTGKLSNGLAYYLKRNAKPENKAELRLVLNVGSVLEDDDQQGLAHFIEHMAFNGTKSFEKNKLIDYLQSLGIEFGADLNAHTGFDETVYKLSVPTDDEAIFNTSLQVLREWADGITFDDEEIDNERGVVAEELRARSGANMRMFYQSIPAITNNSRYAKRLPIGMLDVILNSEYETMKRFYRDWYRPDLMALVLVGDFNVDETEIKIKKLFDDIAPVKKAKERIYYEIPNNIKPAVTIITDKEARGVNISVYHKKKGKAITTLKEYKQVVLQELYSGMLRQRLDEIEVLPDAPFLTATAIIGKFFGNMHSYSLRANLKEDKIKEGIESILIESEKARRYGFTESELERYKSVILNNANIYKKEIGKIPTRYYVEQYIDHFTHGDPIPGDNFIYEFYKEVLPAITLEEVNKVGAEWGKQQNIAVVIKSIAKDGLRLPSKSEILKILSSSYTKDIEPYSDKLGNLELMPEKPKPGKIVKTEYHENVDITTWKLDNGVTVIAKPTDFQNDLIVMNGFRPGGSSLSPDSLYVSAREAGNIISSSGVNNISNIDLKKLNMGKTVRAVPYINFYEELFSGSSSSADLERMLQMVHLYFTAPNKDANVFDVHKERLKSTYKDRDNSPGAFFEKKKSEVMTQNHLRGVPLTEGQIENELKLDEVYNFYKKRLESANNFTFIFVGSFELETLKKLVTGYLGSLPSNLKEENSWKDIGLRRPKGVIKKTFVKGIDDKSKVTINFTGELDFSPEKKGQISLLGKLLKIKLTEKLREKMSGVYGVQVSGFAINKPYDWYRMNIRFTCAPENVDKLIRKVFEEIEKIKNEGVSEADINKIKEAELANIEERLKLNYYWVSQIKNVNEFNLNYDDILDYETKINKIDSEYFKQSANIYFNMNNYAQFILMPENEENKQEN
ncbi:M16 family metallopeptidase [Flavivirga spongiicola]|uniref:Insulinase family protein n=1 Tax=Flavivirga spongiicola TaxID=421621 RepID=A0ABU7XYT0_9FLAO|nr:insulinase family protein [Flavivirga sp. MEBiC05379]MDO5980934.1 insulinase family protein [Flavivirga sp. MEBiC05379]